MAIVAGDLTAPTGELQTAWFADLPGTLAVWIPLGVAQVPSGATTEQADRVTRAYVYWRGFEDVLLRMSADPNSVSIDKGDISASFSKDQRDRFAAKADLWKAEFDAAQSDVLPPVAATVDNAPRVSQSVPFSVSF